MSSQMKSEMLINFYPTNETLETINSLLIVGGGGDETHKKIKGILQITNYGNKLENLFSIVTTNM